MRFGLSMTGGRSPGDSRAPAQVYADQLTAARAADAAGFHTIVVAEHHFLDSGWCPAPLSLAMAIAAQTTNVRVGSGILILPLYHPVRLAEDIALLDVISGGRAVVAVGMGYRAEEFAGYGVAFEERRPRYREALTVLDELLRGGPVDFSGTYFTVEGARISPETVQSPYPPIWIGTTREKGIRAAARAGRAVYLGNAAPQGMLARRVGWYRDELDASGRGQAGVEVPIMREAYVAPTRDAAFDAMRPALEHAYRGELLSLGYGVPVVEADGTEASTHDPGHPALTIERLVAERCIVGDPDDCIAQIREYERLGVTEILLRVHHARLSHAATMESLALFAREIKPVFD